MSTGLESPRRSTSLREVCECFQWGLIAVRKLNRILLPPSLGTCPGLVKWAGHRHLPLCFLMCREHDQTLYAPAVTARAGLSATREPLLSCFCQIFWHSNKKAASMVDKALFSLFCKIYLTISSVRKFIFCIICTFHWF